MRSTLRLATLLSLATAPVLGAQSFPDSFVLAREAYLANDLPTAASLFDAAVRSRPTDADRRAWRADAARRMRAPGLALHEAREALRIDGCQSFAHEVLAGLYNPQFAQMELQSDDSTRVHLEAAVRCDATNGSAWMSLWVQALRGDDPAAERRALAGLKASGIITPAWLAHGRWVLRTLPARAIALAAGDIDTYPVAVAQGVDGERADVVLVNTSLLNIGYVVELLERRHDLPLPPDLDRAKLDFQGERIVAYWRARAAAGTLGRPLAILHSLGLEYAEAGAGSLRLTGPHWEVTAPGPAIDAPAVAAAYRLAESADFGGPFVAPNDRSPARVSSAFSPALMLGHLVAHEAAADGGMRAGRVRWLEEELRRAGVDATRAEAVLAWVRAFPPR